MTLNKMMLSLLTLCLVACQTTERPQPVASKDLLNDVTTQAQQTKDVPPPASLPLGVQQELTAQGLLSGMAPVAQAERRIDVSASDVEAKVFFPSLVTGTPFSVAVHPEVQGTISLSLKGVTLSEVIQVIEDIYGYEISREGRILRVFPSGMRTETFPLNYLYMERHGLSMTSVTSGRISDENSSSSGSNSSSSNSSDSNSNSDSSNNGNSDSGSSNGTFITSKTKSDFWGDLQSTIESIVGGRGDGRQIVVSPQAGLITVRALPSELRQVSQFIKTAETHLQRQVVLEAKIIEVTLSDGYQQGINWQEVAGHSGSTDITFATTAGAIFGNEISTALGGAASVGLERAGDFTAVVNLLDTQGDVDVLSSPRVTASNNQKAVIKVGTDEYFVTEVSSTTVTGTTSVTTPEVELTPFFSGIALDVTPQIDGEGNVLLHVHPSVIDVKEQTKVVTVSDSTLELPLAQSDIRESDTVIKASSGEVVVIGGLMKSESIESVSKVPFLGDIPYLGEAFTNRSQSTNKTELVILLKPTVVDGETWKTELKRSKELLDRWYPDEQ